MVIPPKFADGTFRNWAGTQGASPASFVVPRDEDELAEIVAAANLGGSRVKPVGAGHSWSDAACTDGALVSLDRMRRVHSIDASSGLVSVDGGLRLHELNDALAQAGRALPVLGSISQQSVAGALATGTHGSAPKLGNLASNVVSLRIVLADGSVRDVDESSDPDLFRAARVGLGALGIVTRLTLRTVPAFDLEETVEPMPFDDAVARIPDLVRDEPFVKVWWLPHREEAVVFRYRPTTAPRTFSALQRTIDEKVVNTYAFAAVLGLGAIRNTWIPTLNAVVGAAYFKARTTVGRSDHLLNLAMPPAHDELEYALPLERAQEAFRFVKDTIERDRMHVDFIVELRFTAADDAWLSPSGGRHTCWIGAYAAGTKDRARYFAAVEQQALAWDGRPHWGKRFEATGADLRAKYPHWDDFSRLRHRLDPRRTFDNDFLRRLFG